MKVFILHKNYMINKNLEAIKMGQKRKKKLI